MMDDSALDHLLEDTTENSQASIGGDPTAVMKRKLDEYVNGDDRSQSPSKTQTNKMAKLDEDLAGEPECSGQSLPDHLRSDLDVIIVGVNPGKASAAAGHHYAGRNNHFWPLLHQCGLTSEQFTSDRDGELPGLGIGLTNLVHRTTATSSLLTRDEMKDGAESLRRKLLKLRPKIVCFNGKEIYRIFSGKSDFHLGRQPQPLEGSDDCLMYVMPSSSARCAKWPCAADKLPFYEGLRKLRDVCVGTVAAVDDAEVVFPDIQVTCSSPQAIDALCEYDDEEDTPLVNGGDGHFDSNMDSATVGGQSTTVMPRVNGDSTENSNGPISTENGNELNGDYINNEHAMQDALRADDHLPQDFMKDSPHDDDSQDAESQAAQRALEAAAAFDQPEPSSDPTTQTVTPSTENFDASEGPGQSGAASESIKTEATEPKSDNDLLNATEETPVVTSAGEFDKLLSEAMQKEMQQMSGNQAPDPLDMAIKEETCATNDESFETSTASAVDASLLDSSLMNSSTVSVKKEPAEPQLTASGKPVKVRTPEQLVIEKHIAESVAAVVQRCKDGTQILPEHYIRPSTPPAPKQVAAPPPPQPQPQQPPPAHQQHRAPQQQQANRMRTSQQQQQNTNQQHQSQQQQHQQHRHQTNQQPQQQQQSHHQSHNNQHNQQQQMQHNQQSQPQNANNITNLAANQLLSTIYGAAVGQQQQQQQRQPAANNAASNNNSANTNNPLDYLNYFQQATAAPAGYDQLQRAMQQVAGNYQQQAGWAGGLYDAFFQNNQQQAPQQQMAAQGAGAQQQTAFRATNQQQPNQPMNNQQQNALPPDFYNNYFGSNQNF